LPEGYGIFSLLFLFDKQFIKRKREKLLSKKSGIILFQIPEKVS